MRRNWEKFLLPAVLLSIFAWGCAQSRQPSDGSVKPVAGAGREVNVYAGRIVGKSTRTRTIVMEAGNGDAAKTMTFRFDDNTLGLEFAEKGETAIINWEARGSDKYAAAIKPKRAKLPEGVVELKPEEVKALIDRNAEMMIIDSRPVKSYAQSHLPGAVSITVEQMESGALNMLPSDKDTLLVFYCGGYTCGMSPKAAGLAKKAGYKNIRVMLAGEPNWIKAGYAGYASREFVDKGNIVLIDLRSTEKSETARIPRSVSIPMATLGDRLDDIPGKAPVVLYSDDQEEALGALRKLREAGLKKASLAEGGLDQWRRAGGGFESGPVVTEINWRRKPEPGEVSVADFIQAATGQDPGVVILDVRTGEEVRNGTFRSALAIPLEDLGKRIGELPADRKIYVHCSKGSRAEMAHMELRKQGFNSFYLVAEVSCGDGKCEIDE